MNCICVQASTWRASAPPGGETATAQRALAATVSTAKAEADAQRMVARAQIASASGAINAETLSAGISLGLQRSGSYRGALARIVNSAPLIKSKFFTSLDMKTKYSPCARANGGANHRCAFTTADYRPDHRADRGANARARHGAPVWPLSSCTLPLIIDPDSFTARRPDTLNVSGEVRGAAIAQTDAVELRADISARPEICPSS